MEDISFEQLLKMKFNGLSAGQQRVAEYLSRHLEEAAFSTAAQISRQAEVSETTVIRLSYALGFSGFSDMQSRIIKQIRSSGHSSLPNTPDARRLTQGTDTASPFAGIIDNYMHNLHQTFRQLKEADLWKTIDALIRADRVLVVGFRMSYAAAHWFSLTLSTLRDHVDLCPPTGEVYEKLSNYTEHSVVFAISMPRYAKETLHIASCAKQQGLTVLSVSDRALSPAGRLSDIALTTEESVDSGANSIATVVGLLELIVEGMQIRDSARIQARQQRLEQWYSNSDAFVE